MSEGGITAVFEVNEQLEKDNFPLFQRLTTHFRLYSLGKAYSIQAATEIAENHIFAAFSRFVRRGRCPHRPVAVVTDLP